MTYHHFQVGQFITAHALGVPAGPYRITRLLPLSNGVPQYRLKSAVDDLEEGGAGKCDPNGGPDRSS